MTLAEYFTNIAETGFTAEYVFNGTVYKIESNLRKKHYDFKITAYNDEGEFSYGWFDSSKTKV